MPRNQAVFLSLCEIINELCIKIDDLPADVQRTLADAEAGVEAPAADDDDDLMDMEQLDEVTRAFMRELAAEGGVDLPAPVAKPACSVKAAPTRTDDAMFDVIVELACKKPRVTSKFFEALRAAGPPLTLSVLLKIVKESSSAPVNEEAQKKLLGNTLGAFKWLFPHATK
jgi:hypothetical protein